MKTLMLGIGLALIASAAMAQQQTQRIENYDRYGNRLGYTIINRQTGRADTYDKNSNHTGWSRITPPPSQVKPGDSITVQPGRVIKR